jgi:hypothetical protein
MEYLLFIVGVCLGSLITIIVRERGTVMGVLLIDSSNPEKDVYRFDVGNMDDLSKKKRVILKVENDADLSQK